MKMVPATIIAVLVLFALPAAAQFYRWVDEEGKETYTNDQSKIPENYRATAVTVEPGEGRISTGTARSRPSTMSKAGGEHRDRYGRGEDYWRKRANNLRRELADLQDEYEIILRQERERVEQQNSAGGMNKRSAANTKRKLQLEKKIAKVKRRLDVELPDEARRAEAWPGWIRE